MILTSPAAISWRRACYFIVLPLVSTAISLCAYLSSSSTASHRILDLNTVSLGTLAPGSLGHTSVRLRNTASVAFDIEQIETTCPCVRVVPGGFVLEPGRSILLDVSYDPSEDPKFHGSLAVGFTGRSHSGRTLFRGVVSLAVEKRILGEKSSLLDQSPRIQALTEYFP